MPNVKPFLVSFCQIIIPRLKFHQSCFFLKNKKNYLHKGAVVLPISEKYSYCWAVLSTFAILPTLNLNMHIIVSLWACLGLRKNVILKRKQQKSWWTSNAKTQVSQNNRAPLSRTASQPTTDRKMASTEQSDPPQQVTCASKQLPVDKNGENITVITFGAETTKYHRCYFYFFVQPLMQRLLACLLVSTLGSASATVQKLLLSFTKLVELYVWPGRRCCTPPPVLKIRKKLLSLISTL